MSEFSRQRSLRFLGDEDRFRDCQVFGQILVPEDDVEDPNDDSQWDSSKLTSRETVSGPGETAREGLDARISSALIGLAMESWTGCCVHSGMVTVADCVKTVVQ